MNPGAAGTQGRAGLSDWPGLHGLVFYGLFLAAPLVPLFRDWPLFWIGPIAIYAALVAMVPPLRASFRPLRFGAVSLRTLGAAFVIAVGSCAALVTFHLLAKPDLQSYHDLFPAAARQNLFVTGVIFSVLNALLEEVVFRGILFDPLEAEWGRLVAVLATAVMFGYGHLHGYPPGSLGAVLAGIYALGLGWLRVFSGGIGLTFLAHITADATIFTLLARSGAF